MPRYVVLTHDHPHWHWDFMLEVDGALRTWRLDQEPGSAPAMRATQLPDHRLHYLDYEGPVSGNRGQVARWDEGQYAAILQGPDSWQLNLQGRRLQCQVVLQRDRDSAWRWQVAGHDKQ